jgi:hypothetical protein
MIKTVTTITFVNMSVLKLKGSHLMAAFFCSFFHSNWIKYVIKEYIPLFLGDLKMFTLTFFVQ